MFGMFLIAGRDVIPPVVTTFQLAERIDLTVRFKDSYCFK
jgi:hypothetical protein